MGADRPHLKTFRLRASRPITSMGQLASAGPLRGLPPNGQKKTNFESPFLEIPKSDFSGILVSDVEFPGESPV